MANNQIMVNMKFQADTTQAKAKMQELQNQLSQVMKVTATDLPGSKISNDLNQASIAAAQLKVHLQSAFNQDTGKLDLSKFNQSLKQSGMTLQQYKISLMQAGPVGQQAFNQLAISVAQAEIPIIRISQRMQKLGQTFANTIRWQISSTALMAVTSTLSEAYSFAQDLNESLNEIRIVTGNSADEMARFAKEANNAAKALSTTTTKYTDASLIYFQQGLNEKQVKERTDLTVKMANVTGQSVSYVSDQLTAVWNNFEDGTKTLEHYVDVMTALGAATASSSEEISEGLNKFAAVAGTVGLSYEYAAAALATVTATTRQSADIVGTAFKTLFARIQNLELGKTLDDGTTLGQYSQALAAVGINIKNINGEVKDMNTILDEMGKKWNTLTKDAQIALAQNVAGVRQYTQLIALMDNWSYFQENLNTAYGSTGTLQQQADIYAESWEAARDRVTASLEQIYNSILDDDAFIDILNFFADLFENIGDVTEAIGGLKGVIGLLATALLTLGRNAVINSMQSLSASFMGMTKTGRSKLETERNTALNEVTSNIDTSTASGELRKQYTQDIIKLEQEYQRATERATASQKEMGRILKDNVAEKGKAVELAIQEAEVAEQQLSTASFKVKKNYLSTASSSTQKSYVQMIVGAQQQGAANSLLENIALGNNSIIEANIAKVFNEGNVSNIALNNAETSITQIINRMNQLDTESDEGKQKLQELFGNDVTNALINYKAQLDEALAKIKELKGLSEDQRSIKTPEISSQDENILRGARAARTKARKKIEAGDLTEKELTHQQDIIKKHNATIAKIQAKANTKITNSSEGLIEAYDKQNKKLEENIHTVQVGLGNTERSNKAVEEAAKAAQNNGKAVENARQSAQQFGEQVSGLKPKIEGAIVTTVHFSKKLVAFGSMAMSAAMALNSLKSLIDIWNNEDASFGDKILQSLMSLGIVIPMVTTSFNALNVAKLFGIKVTEGQTVAEAANTGGKVAQTIATIAQTVATTGLNIATATTLVMYGLLLAAILAIIAVVYLVAKGIQVLSDAYNKDAIEAQKTAEKANELAEAYKNTKTAYDELKESIADYGEAQLAINKLKAGTEEWRDAVEASNLQIMELLNKYPELASFIESVNGVLKITDPQAILDIYRNRTNTLYNSSLDANLAVKNAKNRADKTDFIRARGDYYTAEDWFTNIGQKAAVGGIAGGSIGSVPAAVAGVVGGAAYGLVGSIVDNANAADQMEDALTKISGAYQEDSSIFGNFETTLSTLGITNQALIDALITNKEEIIKLTKAEKEALDYEKLVRKQKVNNLLSSWGFSFGDNDTKHLQDLVAQNYDDQVKKEISENYNSDDWHVSGWDTWYSLGFAHRGTEKGETAAKNYADLMGYGEGFDVTDFEGDKIKFKYKKEGEDEYTESEVTYEEMEKVLAEHAVSQSDAVVQYATRINNTITSLKNSGNELGEGVASFLSEGNLDYTILSSEQLENLRQGTLSAIFPKGTDIEQAAIDFGYETIADMTDALKAAAETYDPAQAAANVARRTAQEIESIFASAAEALEVTTDALELYASSLMKTNPELEKNKKLAAQMAVQHFKTAKGLNSLQEAFKENKAALENADKSSLDYYEALGKLNQEIEKTFGVKVSASFLENKENLEDLEKAANNDTEALARLKKAVNEDFILNLNINENTKNILNNKIEELSNLALNSPIGTPLTLDDSQAIAALNEALYTGEATIEQIESMFNNANLQMPEYKTHWVDGEVTRSHSETTTEGPFGIKYTTSSDTVTTAKKAIPYFGDQPPTVDTETGTVTSYGGGGTLSIKSSGNLNSESDVLKYQGLDDSESNKKKTYADEIERYHELKEILSDLEREYNLISDAKNRAWGPDKLAYMKQEQAILQKQLETQRDLINAMKEDVNKDWGVLAKYGAGRDSYGRITNYEKLYQTQIDAYNKGDITEEEYEKFVKAVEQYEASLNGLEEEQQKLLDKNNEIADSKIEEIQYAVEHTVEKIDYLFNALEHQLENLDDPIDDAVKAIAVLGQQTEQALGKIKAYETGIYDIFKQSKLTDSDVEALIGGDMSVLDGKQLTEAQVSALTEYQEALWEANEELNNMGDTVHEKVVAAVEKMNSKLDEQSESISHNNSLLENYRNIIDLVGQDALGISDQVMANLSRASVQGAQAELQAAKAKFDTNKAIYDDTLAEYNAIADQLSDEEKARWDETIKNLEKELISAEEAFMSSWENALQAAADAFDEAVNHTVQTFKDAMAGIAGSNDVLSQRFEQQKEISERYLDDYQKIYELSKLNRDLTKSIDDTDNVVAKTKLRDLQEEINNLQESNTEMTRYEVDELRARYELRLAEISLEETQNAKSQVRMRRDSEGNWSYVYTADQDAVAGAQQGYEDKLYVYQELTQNYIDEMESALIEIPTQMADAIAAIDKNAYESEEQYLKAIEEARAYYTGLYEYHLKQMNGAIEDSAYVYQNDWLAYNEKTGYKISKEIKWRDNFNETIYAQTTGYTTAELALSSFVTNTDTLLDTLAGHYSDWQNDVNTAFDLAGKDVEDFEKTVDEKTKDIQQDNKDTAQSATDMEKKFNTAYDDILGEASAWATEYSNTVQAVIDKNKEVASSISKILALYKRVVDEKPDLSGDYDPEEGGPPKEETPTSDIKQDGLNQEGGETGQGASTKNDLGTETEKMVDTDPPYEEKDEVTGAVDKLTPYDITGANIWYVNKTAVSGKHSVQRVVEVNGVRYYDIGYTYKGLAFSGEDPNGDTSTPFGIQPIWFKEDELKLFDTGGYTGSWDSSGRLAMLHQKEIVLNANDTENFLSAINIVRDIASMIDLRAAAQQSALSQITAASVSPMTQTLEQEVTIHAEFPNATQRTEIEAAFDTLLNRASQFANRKNK